MKILKQGDPKRKDMSKRFECGYCKAVFVAEEGEYRKLGLAWKDYMYVCDCPCCGRAVTLE